MTVETMCISSAVPINNSIITISTIITALKVMFQSLNTNVETVSHTSNAGFYDNTTTRYFIRLAGHYDLLEYIPDHI